MLWKLLIYKECKDIVADNNISIKEELYDVLYYNLGIASFYDIDLEQCYHLKKELNKKPAF
ncbi:hypothetical protein [Pseudalkalibacillus hwajinpoensis]|uniref:hypothetical protein n=1 Tax=Guptibacillus hwajinpoensis TaxID=208199 RepID=UPI001CFC6731|nr:hypothetical protein [Pseudalkalibacillus hwajinpoensis]